MTDWDYDWRDGLPEDDPDPAGEEEARIERRLRRREKQDPFWPERPKEES